MFQIKSHKLILACQSKFFEGFFRRESKDMVMLDFKEEYVRVCVDYMVTGEVNLNVETEQLESVLEVGNLPSGVLLRIWLKQGKEKKILARILKILEKARRDKIRQKRA